MSKKRDMNPITFAIKWAAVIPQEKHREFTDDLEKLRQYIVFQTENWPEHKERSNER